MTRHRSQRVTGRVTGSRPAGAVSGGAGKPGERTARGWRPFGELLRQWRERRRLSQLALALEAGVSTRHLSFVVTGRARPSREMVLHLAEQLDLPLRERNHLLLAAGYAFI